MNFHLQTDRRKDGKGNSSLLRFLAEILLDLSEITPEPLLSSPLLWEHRIHGGLETEVLNLFSGEWGPASHAVIHLKVEFHTSIMQK